MANEKRLIDANDLLEKHTCDVYGAYDDSCMVKAVFVPYIKGAPTVDAVEVVHGQWINKCEPLNPRFDCSACGHIFWNYGIDSFNYCPNCGSKMDGGK